MLLNPSLKYLFERIGKRLYKIRHNRNDKMTSVAKAIHVSHAVISQIENGRYHCLSFGLLSRLANYYNIPVDELLSGDEQNTYDVKDPKTILIDFLIEENKELKARIGMPSQ